MDNLQQALSKISKRVAANASKERITANDNQAQEKRARAAMPADHIALVDALTKRFGCNAFFFRMGKRVFKRGIFS